MKRAQFLLVVLALMWATLASAQTVYLTADYTVKLGKEADFMKMVNTAGTAAYDRLMKDGTMEAWGVDVPLIHSPGGATHTVWIVVKDLGGVEAAQNALRDQIVRMEEEHKKAIEEAKKKNRVEPPSPLETFAEAVDMKSHRDGLYRELFRQGTLSTVPSFSWFSLVRVKPGMAGEFRQLWDKYVRPTYDKLLADKVIYGYTLGVEELKTTDDFTHFVGVWLPNLAAREKVRAAFNAANQARSEEMQKQIAQAFLNVIDGTASRQSIARTVMIKTAGK